VRACWRRVSVRAEEARHPKGGYKTGRSGCVGPEGGWTMVLDAYLTPGCTCPTMTRASARRL
jgi:hypothetical protein